MVKRIPDRWRDYDPCKWIPIKDERVIAFKTPLSKKYDHEFPDDDGILESERFTPTDFVDGLAEKGFNLGLIIDFTFTKRYYDPQEFEKKGILYTKMMCPGHEIPNEKDVKRFEYEVHSFLDKDKSGKLVGVHCTHGVNRTGYMVCRFLIDCRGYKPEDAIQAFNDARGHPVERENYLEDLKSRTPGHGVDFTPESEDPENGRPSVKDRLGLPPWRQRDNDTWQRRGNSFERERNHYNQPNWRGTHDRPTQRSWGQPAGRSYNDRPPQCHFDMYQRDHQYFEDSYHDNRYSYHRAGSRDSYHGNRSSHPRDGDRYQERDYEYYDDRREFDSKGYSRDYMLRNDESYSRNNRYHPYSGDCHSYNRRWQREAER